MQTTRLFVSELLKQKRVYLSGSSVFLRRLIVATHPDEDVNQENKPAKDAESISKDHSPVKLEGVTAFRRTNNEMNLDRTEKRYLKYSSLSKRLGSTLIDFGVAFAIGGCCQFFIEPIFGLGIFNPIIVNQIVTYPIYCLSDCLSPSSRSLGKHLMHIKVVDKDNNLATKIQTVNRALWFYPLMLISQNPSYLLAFVGSYQLINFYCVLRYRRDFSEYMTNLHTIDEGSTYTEDYKRYKEHKTTKEELNMRNINVFFLLFFMGFTSFITSHYLMEKKPDQKKPQEKMNLVIDFGKNKK
ncbi:hypothetical protein WA158_000964 [Blastocystis sp. Blastoise]